MISRSLKVLSVSLIILLLCLGNSHFFTVDAQTWDGTAAHSFDSGNGTQGDPYVIKTADELAYLAEKVNGGSTYRDVYFVLEADIRLNDETFEFDNDTGLVKVSGQNSTAYLGTGICGDGSKDNTVFDTDPSEIGAWYISDTSNAKGTYNGVINDWTPIGKDGKRFEGFFDGQGHIVSGLYVNTTENYGGLFGYSYATLENLSVENSYVRSGEFAGAVAGCNLGETSGCTVGAVVCSLKNNVGGVVGKGGVASKCFGACVVKGEQNVGGIAGVGKTVECCSINTVIGTKNVGGIVGSGRGSDNLNSADVFGKESVGGICGNLSGSSYILSTSYNCGRVFGEKYVGSVLGRLDLGNVKNCYYLKGLAIDSSNKVQNGFGAASSGKSRTDQSGVTEGFDLAQAKVKENFVGFDFDSVWTLSSDETPILLIMKKSEHTHVYDNACDNSCNTCGEVRGITHSYKSEYSKDAINHWYECSVCAHKNDIEEHRYASSCDSSCDDCGYERNAPHNYEKLWSSDKTSHWHKCADCEDKKDLNDHIPGAQATETTPQTCTVCDYVIVAALGHTHKYSNAWSSDETSHWHACPCGAKQDISQHTFDNACDTTCNACAYVRVITHSYKSTWSSDKMSHWKECTVCYYKKDLDNHIPGAQATETTPQTCTVCDYVIVAALGHTHKYSNAWSSDETSHWHACPCGAKQDISQHTFDNACDTTCNDCAYVRVITHSYKSTWSSDKMSHWKECTICLKTKDQSPHTPGAQATETTPQICTVCDYVIVAALGHTHKYSNAWSSDETSHWYACPCGAKQDISQHTFDNACDTTCNDCAYVRVITHSYKSTWSSDKASHWKECTICLKTTDHSPHTPGAQATETTPQTCTVCDYVIVAALGHTHKYSNAWSSDETSHWHACPCGAKQDISSHTFDNACDTTCNACAYVRVITHSYKSTWSSDKMSHWKECTVCYHKKDLDNHIPGAQATETTPQTCTVCDYVIVDALGHTHKYSNAWSSDETSHWHACPCGAKQDISQHTFDNACDTTCNDCAYVRVITHSYKSTWSSDKASHWKECTICLKTTDHSPHTPGAQATETTPQICTVCDYVIVAALGHTHKYSNAWSSDETSHWYACPCGAKQDISSHTFDNACDTTCNACAYVRVITHSYKNEWSSDQISHWHECTVCYHKKDLDNHIPGAQATETTPQTCTVCDYVIVAALGHTHKYSNAWSSDETSHWHACPCGAKQDISQHTFDNACDTTCNDCAYVRVITHSYKSTWSSDKATHWKECIICLKTTDQSPHTPGTQATETTPQTCKVCDYVIVAALGHTHKYSNAWSSDETSHWHACPCGAKQDISQHTFDNACDTTCNACAYVRIITHSYKSTWSSDKASHWKECTICYHKKDLDNHIPGAQATETRPQTCTVCDYVIVAALGHTHKYSNAWSSDETSHWHACSCGAKQDIASHTFDNACDTTCNACAYVRVITHSYKSTWSSDKTSHWYECSICHTQKSIEAHEYDNACDTTCNVCAHTRAITHDYKAGWSSDKSYHWHDCSVCGEKADLATHIPGPAATETAPQSCTVCGFVIASPIGHTHDYSNAWSSDQTNHWKICICGDKGSIEKHEYDSLCDNLCNVCHYERTVTHSYGNAPKYGDKTHWLECSVCHKKNNEEIHVFDGLCDADCNACDFTRKVNHVFGDQIHRDENGHWQQCVLCKLSSDPQKHIFDGGTLIKEPTTHEEGIMEYKCTFCQFTKNEIVKKLPQVSTDAFTTASTPITDEPVTSEPSIQTSHVTDQTTTAHTSDNNAGCSGNVYLILVIVLAITSLILLVTLILTLINNRKRK